MVGEEERFHVTESFFNYTPSVVKNPSGGHALLGREARGTGPARRPNRIGSGVGSEATIIDTLKATRHFRHASMRPPTTWPTP
jgi:hypothetical protein